MRTDEDGREILSYYIQPGESCIMSLLGGIDHETSKVSAVAEKMPRFYLSLCGESRIMDKGFFPSGRILSFVYTINALKNCSPW